MQEAGHAAAEQFNILELTPHGVDRHRNRAVAVGAFAIGALAIGRLAIRRLAVENAKFKSLEIADLTVTRLHAAEVTVSQSLKLPGSNVDQTISS